MPSSAEAAAERKAVRAAQMGSPLPPVDQNPLPCPRCDSKNTKFCYYNNYNFSQPRHFCKGCRRYWTQGGALRDIPVGGGTRKSAKRSRTNSLSPSSYHCSTSSSPVTPSVNTVITTVATSSVVGSVGPNMDPIPSVPVMSAGSTGGSGHGFTSLLSLGGFGLGLGLEEVGFGLGRGVWAFPEVGSFVTGGYNLNGGGGDHGSVYVSRGGDTWLVQSGGDQQGSSHHQYVGVGPGHEGFGSLPELAISTPGNGLK